MRKIFAALLFVVAVMASGSEGASTSRWEIVDGRLAVGYAGSSETLYFEEIPGSNQTGFQIRGEFTQGTQINLPLGWSLVVDERLITASNMTRITRSDELDDSVVIIYGSNSVTLNVSGLWMSAWQIRKEHPDYIAAHYQAWYREPTFSSQDSKGIPDNYEYNWTLRQHGSEDVVRFFSADKTVNGQGEIAGYQYPLTNFYDSRDGDLQRYHAALMKIAGINAVIFDFYGAADIADYRNPRVNSDSFIKNVLDPAGIHYLVFYEEFSAFAKDYGQEQDVTLSEARERIRNSFKWLKDNWFSREGYVRHNGRPVVMLFITNAVFKTRSEWENIAREAGLDPLPYFVCHYNSLPDYQASFNWMPVDAVFSSPSERKHYSGSEREELIRSSFDWFDSITWSHDYCVGTAYPGFDDSVFDELGRFGDNGSHNAIDFEDGAVFRQTFDLALKLKPRIVQLGTWNDYNEDTVTEPTVSSLCHQKQERGRGYSSLEYVQKRKGEWSASGWTAEDLRAPIELYRLSKNPNLTSAQKNRINEAYASIFRDDPVTFRRLASSIISYDLSVRPILRLSVSGELPDGVVKKSYSMTLKAEGGTSPYKWTKASGTLPTGLKLNASTGKLSGTPTKAGTFKFTVKLTDSNGTTATKSYAVKVTSVAIAGTLGDGVLKASYTGTLTASGGTSPYTWTVSSGTLPTGLKLGASTGTLSGKPTKAGSYTFMVRVSDKNGVTASKAFVVTITKPAITGTLSDGVAGKSYSKTLKAAGGTVAYTWTISKGSLPPGLTLGKSTGKISGKPTTAGKYSFTVKVTDKNKATATKAYSITVTAPTIAGTLSDGVIKAAYSITLTAGGGTSPYKWSVSSGTLPTGLKLGASTGTLSGTPTKAGTFTFTLKVTDKNKVTGTRKFTVTITAPTISGSLGSGTVGKSYSKTLKATGGTPAYTWTKSSGTLPAGLKLGKTNGKLTGTPTKAGNYTFTVKITDKNKATATKKFTVKIAAATTKSAPAIDVKSYAVFRTELHVRSEDVMYQGLDRDSDLVTVRAGEPVTFVLGEWPREVSSMTVCINGEPNEDIMIADDGTFTLPAEMVSDDFRVCVKAQSGESELESEELFISAQPSTL